VHTFGCPVFALQNALASGKSLPRWSPRARLGLNLGPSPMHARNVYLVLNLITGCVSPQYQCCFVDFFETTRHGGPDVSGTICWQQLAGLDRVTAILSEVSTPTPHSVMYIQRHHLREKFCRRTNSRHRYSMSLRTTTVSLTEILMSQSTPSLLANHGLLFGLRESHQLSILSLLVPLNVDRFAQGTHQDIPY
jgi:hypothetical protein